ncbi:MAG: YebC/PmpR family DNA-binding transcriptional regulator [Patescibacteria group bacterium]
MSGHSKWATTKRQKAVVDAKKGNIFTKIAKLIAIASRKGKDPTTNFSLRIAIEKARDVNMPKDNIERAIKRGSGELGEAQIEELIYEGIGPAKTQFIVKCLTDSKNRAAAEIRHIFLKYNGSLSAVMWNFNHQAVIRIANHELKFSQLACPAPAVDKGEKGNFSYSNFDEFELGIIDQGAEDIIEEEEGITIYAAPVDLQKIKQFLENKNIKTESAEIEYVAKEHLDLKEEEKSRVEKFINELEENEDVAGYYTNANM